MKTMRKFKEKKYRVIKTKGIFQPQVKWLLWWINLPKAYMSLGEASRAINSHHAERLVKFYNQNKVR